MGFRCRLMLRRAGPRLRPSWIICAAKLPPKGIDMTILPNAVTKEYADGKLLQSIGDGIGVLTFNYPERLNAISVEIAAGLAEALTTMKDDPAVRVLILTGAGEKAFISGG